MKTRSVIPGLRGISFVGLRTASEILPGRKFEIPRKLGMTMIAGLFLLTVVGCERAPKSCQVCQRAECKGLAFRVTLSTGKRVETCCPRCGLHYLESTKQPARTLQATDLSDGQWIDATKAVYVSGSDISPCASMEAKRDAYGCCAIKGFDRCQPSLIAFASADAAQTFAKEHGGQLITGKQLTAKSE